MYVSIGVFKLLSVHVLTLWLCAQQVSSQQASASASAFVEAKSCKVVLHLSMYLLLTYLSTYISYSFVYLFNF